MLERRTTAWTIDARTKPRMSAQRIAQAIDPATAKACPRASRTLIDSLALLEPPGRH
jgi:hypothetical protein